MILYRNMLGPVSFDEPENRMLQEFFLEIYQDDRVRSLEGPVILSILKKLETWPDPPIFTEQENRRIQWQLVYFIELLKPYPYPYSPLTFGQDTRQLQVLQSALAKLS